MMGSHLDEHLLFWQPAIPINLYFCTVSIVLLYKMQIKYDDDDQTTCIIQWKCYHKTLRGL